MLRYYMDHHVNGAITRALRRRGIDCLTCEEDRTKRMSDETLLARATVLGRVFVSADEDLLRISATWQEEGRDFAGLIALRKQHRIGQTINDLELIANIMTPEELLNQVERVPL